MSYLDARALCSFFGLLAAFALLPFSAHAQQEPAAQAFPYHESGAALGAAR